MKGRTTKTFTQDDYRNIDAVIGALRELVSFKTIFTLQLVNWGHDTGREAKLVWVYVGKTVIIEF